MSGTISSPHRRATSSTASSSRVLDPLAEHGPGDQRRPQRHRETQHRRLTRWDQDRRVGAGDVPDHQVEEGAGADRRPVHAARITSDTACARHRQQRDAGQRDGHGTKAARPPRTAKANSGQLVPHTRVRITSSTMARGIAVSLMGGAIPAVRNRQRTNRNDRSQGTAPAMRAHQRCRLAGRAQRAAPRSLQPVEPAGRGAALPRPAAPAAPSGAFDHRQRRAGISAAASVTAPAA